MRNRLVLLVAGIAAFGILLAGLLLLNPVMGPGVQQNNLSGIVVDQPAPDFEVIGLDGATYRLSDLRGRVVFLNFWATWCIPCRAEMAAFQTFQAVRGEDALILAVNADAESPEAIRSFLDEIAVAELTIGVDPDRQVANLYGVNPLPTTFVIDSDGVVRTVRFGEMAEQDLHEITDFLMRTG
jgi:peroxiredoxin